MFGLLEKSTYYAKTVVWLPAGSRPSVGIFTSVPLKAGQIVYYNYPLAVVPSAGHCAWCLYPSKVECEQCTTSYCSTQCRDLARPIHQRICAQNLSVEAQLLVEAASKNHKLSKSTPYQPNWSCLFALQSQGPPLDAAFEAGKVIKFDFQEASRRLLNNNFQITNSDLQGVGCGIFPFGALLNHSCQANTSASYYLKQHQRPLLGFLVLTDIVANAELTHNYCDLLGTREQRWKALGFQCVCGRCQNPWLVEKYLVPDPEAEAELERAETLPLREQSNVLFNLNTRSLSVNRRRHVRLVEISVLLNDLNRGYKSAVWVYNFDLMCYAHRTHPALQLQNELLQKLRLAGAS